MNINATLLGGECPRSSYLTGRMDQTPLLLRHAGKKGITSPENPADCLADHVQSLREMGFTITTDREPHSGDYPGHQARYRLRCSVILDGPALVAAQ